MKYCQVDEWIVIKDEIGKRLFILKEVYKKFLFFRMDEIQ